MPAPITFQRTVSDRNDSPNMQSSYPNSYHGILSGSFGNYAPFHDSSDMYREESSTFLPRLEANFCKDFSCCGLILDDLHHLLQHYEDHHVRLEDELMSNVTTQYAETNRAASTMPARPDLEQLKKQAMLDMQYHLQQYSTATNEMSCDSEDIAFDGYSQYGETIFPRKRALLPSSPTVVTTDLFTPAHSPCTTPDSSVPATPVMQNQHDFVSESDNPLLFGPPTSSDEWLNHDGSCFMPQIKKARTLTQRHQGFTSPEALSPKVVEHPGSNLVVVDKPYKCPIAGCDKAYKNQNGLKYHKMHGNCATSPMAFSATNSSGQPVSHMVHENKPYSCTLCTKRYKNLNGLKYHTAHSHQHVTTDSVLRVIQDSQRSSAVW